MVVVSIDIRQYTLDLEQLVCLCSEWLGDMTAATSGSDGHSVEFGFEGSSAAVHAKAFRNTLDTCFRRPDPAAEI